MIPRRLSAGDDGLKDVAVLLLDERHQVDTIFGCHDEDPLPRILRLVRMAESFQETTGVDCHYYDFEGNPSVGSECLVLLGAPPKRLRGGMLRAPVPIITMPIQDAQRIKLTGGPRRR